MTDSASPPQLPLRPPELLAPARDEECVRAAVANGADAVYFGLGAGFNARARAAGILPEDLPRLMEWLRRRRVRGYVTLNTLVFTSELDEAERTIRQIAAAGADAVLVQDLGVLRLAREVCPSLTIHASTQMSLSSAEGIRLVESLGVGRVVLARELSLDEIRQVARGASIELEVFVHGALCVAYSGQCMTSESLGGRSANRGQCAQACRLPYKLVCDGCDVDTGDVKYLLSPQDLAAWDLVPELIAAGVAALKIEGRLKSPEYVANVTRHYREAIDTAMAGRPVSFTPRDVEELELSFSRGFSHGWLAGDDHKALVPGTSSAKRGVLLGEVVRVRGGRVAVQLARAVKRGDGVAFEGGRAEGRQQGGRVFEVFQGRRSLAGPVQGGVVELTFAHGAIDFAELRPGQKVWKTDDPQLTRRLRKTFETGPLGRRAAVDVVVSAEVGRPLVVEARSGAGASCRVESPGPLAAAQKHPLDLETLRQQLGRLGSTRYELRELSAAIAGRPMVPLSVLGAMRHEMVRRLDAAGDQPPRWIAEQSVLPAIRTSLVGEATRGSPLPLAGEGSGVRATRPSGNTTVPADLQEGRLRHNPPVLHVLCRSLDQLGAGVAHGEKDLMADFRDIRQYREAVEAAHAAGASILLATPRIQKPGELGVFRALARHGPDGLLVRNLAGAAFCAEQGVPFVTDFSLNAANELAVAQLRALGAARVTVSYDLNREQVLDLVAAAPPQWLEVVVHQHMPLFHMEHCVFCALLSPGRNKTDCGRPCDRHQVRLRDHVGMEHLLTADVGCRNTLYNAVPQSGAEAVHAMLNHGVRHFRVELLDDLGPGETPRTIGLYRRLLAGELSGKAVWKELKASNRVGVTRGTLEERRNPLAIL